MGKIHEKVFANELNIDISRLRPKNSYGLLFEDRDYVIKGILSENNGIIPSSWLVERPCPVCLDNLSNNFLTKDSFNLVQCANCEFVNVNPTLKESKYIEIYQQKNYGHIIENLSLESQDYRKERFGSERMDLITKYSNIKFGRVLEIGAGSGFFIEEVVQRGWEGIGLELSEPAVQFAKNRGIPIYNKTLEDMDFRENEFDVVTAFDVLEHIFEPKRFISYIKKILKPGGVLLVYVPNLDSASFHLLGESAHFIWPTHHLSYFTPRTIRRFFSEMNFREIFLETKGLDMVDYIWQRKNLSNQKVEELESISNKIQFYINSAGYGKNLRILVENVKNS